MWCKTPPPVGGQIRSAHPILRAAVERRWTVVTRRFEEGAAILGVLEVGTLGINPIHWVWDPRYDTWARRVPD